MLEARSYQTEAERSIWEYFKSHSGNPIVAMPTGTGKSVVIAMFLQNIFRYYPNQKIIILTHVKELIAQNYLKLLSLWPFAPAGVYSSGLNRKETHFPITFAGIASVHRHPEIWGKVDLVLVDECHLISPTETTMYQRFINALAVSNPLIKVVGFTATPWRMGHGKLIDPVDGPNGPTPSLFSDVCFDITGTSAFNRLIAEGYIAPLIPKKTRLEISIEGVHIRGGEFISSELELAVDKDDISANAVREAMEYDDRKCWLCFTAGVNHAINVAEIMNSMGVSAVAIHSKLTTAERDDAIKKFKAGVYRCAVNNNVLTTGFDHPPIDLILVLRHTMSAVLWVQLLGRGTRPYDPANPGDVNTVAFPNKKENCLVLDYANNTPRLGQINDPVVPRKKGVGTGEAPVKLCPKCECWVHAGLRFCDGTLKNGAKCNHEFVFDHHLNANAGSIDLIKGDLPIVEVFNVDIISFTRHQKLTNPPTVRVSYLCGLREFSEWVCIEHTNYAGRKAREWWRQRSDSEPPASVEEFLLNTDKLKVATQLKVWINKKYPEILSACFDGTSFGQYPSNGHVPSVQVENKEPIKQQSPLPALPALTEWDDDIPF